jgi:hypothetical protein
MLWQTLYVHIAVRSTFFQGISLFLQIRCMKLYAGVVIRVVVRVNLEVAQALEKHR